MSAQFVIPDWLPRAKPDPLPPVSDHGVEDLVNHFIAGKQAALFTAPDAFYRLERGVALDGQPAIVQRLQDLRAATLDLAGDDGERAALGPRLDLHLSDAMDGIGRHVATQRQAWQRQIISERQTLLERAAQYEHDNDDKVLGLAHANASAAQERARMDGVAPDSPEEAAILGAARSRILHTALAERIGNGKDAQALALFERVKDQLSQADRRALEVPMQVAATNTATDAWLQREADAPGAPLADRAAADPTLSADQKMVLAMKIAARESAETSRRYATVLGLDDQRAAATRSLATQPADYRTGTFAALATAYDAAGESAKADEMRRAALQEPMLRAFALSSPAHQRDLIDSLPPDDQAIAAAMQRYQADAFARNAFGAGTALYSHVGPPEPITDFDRRVVQARKIAAIRQIDVPPLTTAELAKAQHQFATSSPEEREAVLQQVNALPDDAKRPLISALSTPGEEPNTMSDAIEEQPADGAQYAQAGSGNIRTPRVRPLTPRQLMEIQEYESKIDVIRQLEPENRFAGPRVRAEESPIEPKQMQEINEELADVRARAAERDLRNDELARGQTTPGPRPSRDDLVRDAAPRGLIGRLQEPSRSEPGDETQPPRRILRTEEELQAEQQAKKYDLKASSPTTRRILENLQTPLEQFVSDYRAGSLWRRLPDGLKKVTVREALESGDSTARKLILQERFGK